MNNNGEVCALNCTNEQFKEYLEMGGYLVLKSLYFTPKGKEDCNNCCDMFLYPDEGCPECGRIGEP